MGNESIYTAAVKRQVVQEYFAGADPYGLAHRYCVSVTEIRIWVDQYLQSGQGRHRFEAGVRDGSAEAAPAVRNDGASARKRRSRQGARGLGYPEGPDRPDPRPGEPPDSSPSEDPYR